MYLCICLLHCRPQCYIHSFIALKITMSLWNRAQQLPQDALKQVQNVYNEHFPIEVRHYLAGWIEEKIHQWWVRIWNDVLYVTSLTERKLKWQFLVFSVKLFCAVSGPTLRVPCTPQFSLFVGCSTFFFFIISFISETCAGQPAHAEADMLVSLMGFSGCDWLRLLRRSSTYETANAYARIRQC